MLLHLVRFSTSPESTLGALIIDGVFECFTLEDTFRFVKRAGHTRIPEGLYEVTLRTVGGTHKDYLKLFPALHKGMLWVRDVPGFTHILFHRGNAPKDTEGCILVGDVAYNNQTNSPYVGRSTLAYLHFYERVLGAFDREESVSLRVSSMY